MAIRINSRVVIPEEEISFTYARSGGPGGQKVNKTSTRATLLFDVDASPSLTDADRARIRERLSTRISKDGVLRVVSQKHRTQTANRRAALERFTDLLQAALKPGRRRKPTAVPGAVKEKRLKDKRHRSRLKRERAGPYDSDG
ncbi:MAG: alternative ribosome rescue aminoacyl-tRNA hydrolase ArfB [bacterium]